MPARASLFLRALSFRSRARCGPIPARHPERMLVELSNGKRGNQAHLPDSRPTSHFPGPTLLRSVILALAYMSHHLNGIPIAPVQPTSLLLDSPVPYLVALRSECPKPIVCRFCCNHLRDCRVPEVHFNFGHRLPGKSHCGPAICISPLLKVSFVKQLAARPKDV